MAKASDFEGKKQDDLFYFVDYSPEEAERVGYSNYSYWGSVVQNFLKHKMAVVCLVLFLFLVIFSFIALAVGKYDYQTLITDSLIFSFKILFILDPLLRDKIQFGPLYHIRRGEFQ